MHMHTNKIEKRGGQYIEATHCAYSPDVGNILRDHDYSLEGGSSGNN